MKNNLFLRQLGEYFDVFLPEVHRVSPNTISAYADSFAVFFQFLYESKGLEHYNLSYKHFNANLFDEFIPWMKKERDYSDSSIRHRLTALTAFLKYASRREVSAISAYTSVSTAERPSAVQAEFPYFTLEEMQIILSLPDHKKYLGDRDLVLLSLLYESGARAQEICNLCVGHIRFGKPTKVKLNGKLNKLREVPISDEVSDLLKWYFKQKDFNHKEKADESLFASQTNAKMTTACIRGIVDKYVGIAKSQNPKLFLEKHYSPHSFRHSKAVHMVESGVNLIYIRNFLGHATIGSTEIYARVGQAAVDKALRERKIPRIAANTPKTDEKSCPLPDCIQRAR